MSWLTNFEDGAIATEKTKIDTFYAPLQSISFEETISIIN